MDRNSEYFYLFYDKTNKKLIQLDMLSLYSEEISFMRDDSHFELYGFTYDDEEYFVRDISHYNDMMEEKFRKKFHINPVYTLYQVINQNGDLAVLIQNFHGTTYKFILGKPISRQEDKFGFITIGSIFNLPYMIWLHGLMLNSTIFKVGYNKNGLCYKVKLGSNVYDAKVENANPNYCFLNIKGADNNCVFEYYNIDTAKIANLLTRSLWSGYWPEDKEETIYAIMNFINRNYSVNNFKDFDINDEFIGCNGKVYNYKQCKKGKWYLAGDINEILEIFHLNNIGELRKLANKILGHKKRLGVFPGCDSKEELITLIQRLKS